MHMIRLLLWGATFFFAYRLIKPWLSKHISIHISDQPKEIVEDEMVKDPYCETYFPKRHGVHARINGQDVYFCSKKCRDKYIH